MSKITQYSRLSHHTLSGSASATFSVPPSEDFTDGTWNVNGTELALSEIGVNEDSKKAYIRINDEIKEIQFTGVTASASSLEDTLVVGNTTGANNIIVDNSSEIVFGTSSGLLFNNTSRLREGTIDAGYGGNKGIAQICAVGYEMKWESGSLYIMNGDGTQIREVRYTFGATPSLSDDVTKGFTIGSRWVLDNGNLYTCSDTATSSAVWNLEAVGVGNLEQTLSVGNTTNGYDIIVSTDDLIKGGGSSSISLGTTARPNEVKIYTEDALNTNELAITPGTSFQTITDLSTTNSVIVGSSPDSHQVTVADVASNITDNFYINPQVGVTGISSEDFTTGNSTTTTHTPNTIISAAYDIATGITDTISIDPQDLGNGTGIKSEDATTGSVTQTYHKPDYINLISADTSGNRNDIDINSSVGDTKLRAFSQVTSEVGLITLTKTNLAASVTDASNTSNMGLTKDSIILDATDSSTTITDTISTDPQGLGNGTGIKSENATSGIYSETTITPDTICHRSVDGAGETSQIFVTNGAGQGVEIVSGDANNYSLANFTSGYTTITLTDITNNQVDSITLDTGYTGITSQDTISNNIASSIYTPAVIQHQATYVASDITDTISLDPQGLVNGTGIFSEDGALSTSSHIKIQSQSPSILSSDGTNVGTIDVGPGYVTMTANDGAAPITDSILIDPQLLSGGTSISSINYMTSDFSNISFTPTLTAIKCQSSTTNSSIEIDAERITYICNSITTREYNAQTNTTAAGSTASVVIISPESGSTIVKVRITGYDGTSNNGYGSTIFAVFTNNVTTTTQVSTTDLIEKSDFTTASSDISINGTDIEILLIPDTTYSIVWKVYVEYSN